MKPLVVVSSSNAEFSLFVRHILETAGLAVVLAIGSRETHSLAVREAADAILLDGHLTDAVSLCEQLKSDPATSHLKIVALIGQRPANHYTAFVNAGIDEGFVRPVEPRRFVDALKALTRMSAGYGWQGEGAQQRHLTYADIDVDLYTRRVRRAGLEVHLTAIEFELLRRLMEEPTRVFRREELIETAWPRGTYVDRRTVNIHIGRLKRQLMAAHPANVIRTVRGAGYALDTTDR